MTQSEWTTRCRSAQGRDTHSRFVRSLQGIVVLLAMLGAASVAEAQVAGSLDELLQSGELQFGDEIFVTDVSGRRIKTRIRGVSAIALSVTEGRNTRTLRDTDVSKIERWDSVANGSLYGLGIGFAAMLGTCRLESSSSGDFCYRASYLFYPGLAVGALVGGIVDARLTKTILQKPGSARVAVSPMLAKKGLGARISLTW